jgi:hypothetical protein
MNKKVVNFFVSKQVYLFIYLWLYSESFLTISSCTLSITQYLRIRLLRDASISQELVAHACNASYSGGRDQENPGLKLAWANSSQDLSKKPITKKVWSSSSRCRS